MAAGKARIRRLADDDVLVATEGRLFESPVWDNRDQKLAWVDIDLGRIHSVHPATGSLRTSTVGSTVGCLALRRAGGFVAAIDGRVRAVDENLSRGEVLADGILAGRDDLRFNDGCCAPDGSLWVGTTSRSKQSGTGYLFRVAQTGVGVLLDGVRVSNGIGWPLGGQFAYYVDSHSGGIDQLELNAEPDGTIAIAGRTRWVQIEPGAGVPDGVAVDAEGALWVALWGGGMMQRYSAAGELVDEIAVPVPYVTSACLGGPHRRQLFITTANDRRHEAPHGTAKVFHCTVDTPGVPAFAYAG